jgi:hypothetical protein
VGYSRQSSERTASGSLHEDLICIKEGFGCMTALLLYMITDFLRCTALLKLQTQHFLSWQIWNSLNLMLLLLLVFI